jgi:trigger factor
VNVSVTDVSELRKELTVSLTSAELVEEEQVLLKEFQKQAKVPGFRQGKAPFPMLRQRFRKTLQEELGKKVMARAYQFAVEDRDLKVFNIVEAQPVEEIDTTRDLAVDLTVDLTPEFELPTYKGLETKVPSTEVSDEEVEASIEHMRRERADFKPVERAAEAGDYVKLSYTGKVGDQTVAELIPDEPANKSWSAIENGWEEAGTDEAKRFGVPAVIDGVVGMAAGESKTVEEVFAADFKIAELQGLTAQYEITVHEVRQRVLPELDEDFLKGLQLESVEELKERILDHLEKQKKQRRAEVQRRQIIDQLLMAVEFPLPQSAIDQETQNVMGRIMVENMQRGVAREEFEENKESLHAQSAQIAVRDVKLRFVVAKIAQAESIEVTQEDLSRAIMSVAMQQRRKPEELVKELREDRNQVSFLQQQVLMGKTLDFLTKEAKVEISEDAGAPVEA